MHITLPDTRGSLETYALRGEALPMAKPKVPFNRVAFAAAHVVADPFGNADPSGPPAIDWGATLAYRRHLLDLGFGIAEAMGAELLAMGSDLEDPALSARIAVVTIESLVHRFVATDRPLDPEPFIDETTRLVTGYLAVCAP